MADPLGANNYPNNNNTINNIDNNNNNNDASNHDNSSISSTQLEQQLRLEISQRDALIVSMRDKTKEFVSKLRIEHSEAIDRVEEKYKAQLKVI